jgi:hypothetical protein
MVCSSVARPSELGGSSYGWSVHAPVPNTRALPTYTCAAGGSSCVKLSIAQLALGGDGKLGNLVHQLLEYLLRIVELGFDLLEHGEVVDDLLGKGIDGGGKVCERGQEARRAVGGLWCLLEPVGSESPSKSARIVVGRPHGGSALSGGRAGARCGRHGGWTGARAGDGATTGALSAD